MLPAEKSAPASEADYDHIEASRRRTGLKRGHKLLSTADENSPQVPIENFPGGPT
jgi:hypothetical protein